MDQSKLIVIKNKLISDELKMSKKTYELCFDEEGLRIIPIGEDQVKSSTLTQLTICSLKYMSSILPIF